MMLSYSEEDESIKKDMSVDSKIITPQEKNKEYEDDSQDKLASKKEQAYMVLKANTFRRPGSDSKSDSDYIEVLYKLTFLNSIFI